MEVDNGPDRQPPIMIPNPMSNTFINDVKKILALKVIAK